MSTRFRDFNFVEGAVLPVNKPYKWTSFDVVNKIRSALKPHKIKVGHAGTLDPLATGLLIVCTGKLTKQTEQYQAEEKEYTGTLVLGATTPSFDLETDIEKNYPTEHLNEKQIRQAATLFVGNIEQYPPAHSAVKVNGERLYTKARQGEEVELPKRAVTITAFEITRINLPEVDFRVICSKGTYIRSLAHDFGKELQSGAYLAKLTRIRSGNFVLQNAFELKDLIAFLCKQREKKVLSRVSQTTQKTSE